MVRRGRGYAPEPLPLPVAMPDGQVALAAGAELKHTFALAIGGRAHIAPHTGDLEDLTTHQAYEDNRLHLERLLAVEPSWVVHDLHPGYLRPRTPCAGSPPSGASPSSTTTPTSPRAPLSTA